MLLAGAGVAGSVAALQLAHRGVRSVVVERARKPSALPYPVRLGERSRELLRPVATVSALITGPALIGRLRRALVEHPLVDLRTGWTLTDARTEADGVVATVLDATAGARHVVEAGYLAGCDGAQSTVRRCANLPLQPLGPPAPHLTVYFRTAEVAAPPPGPSPDATVICGHDGDVCVAHLPVSPDEAVTVTDPAELLRQRLGMTGEPPEILAVVQRDGVPAVAKAYRRGRIFLAGQSAHQAGPPSDDVDTSIGDAVDLGRRLAAAVHGGAESLAGYEAERRRHALPSPDRAQIYENT